MNLSAKFLIRALLFVFMLAGPVSAQTLSLNMGATGGQAGAGDAGSVTGHIVQLLALLTVLSIAPGILMAHDMLHPHHHCSVAVAFRHRHGANAAEHGVVKPCAVPDRVHHGADIRKSLRRRNPAPDGAEDRREWPHSRKR